MEDCKHVEYDMDGPHCKIGKSKGFQCRRRFGEDCGYYEPKETCQHSCETKIEDYTLKDVKRMCEQQIDCPGCPLYDKRCDCCSLVDRIPERWRFKNDKNNQRR